MIQNLEKFYMVAFILFIHSSKLDLFTDFENFSAETDIYILLFPILIEGFFPIIEYSKQSFSQLLATKTRVF